MSTDIDTDRDDAPIRPAPYTPPDEVQAPRARAPRRRQLTIGTALLAALLVLWFLLGARTLEVTTVPRDAQFDIDGGMHLKLGRMVLLREGSYELTVEAKGYATRRQTQAIDARRNQQVEVVLEKLPGLLRVETTPVVARILLDGTDAGQSNAAALEVPAGTHVLRLEADRFLPAEQTIEIEGMEIEQALAVELAPGWGSYRVQSDPPGATILLDEQSVGTTPADVELMAGRRTLRLQSAGFRDEPLTVEAQAGERRELPVVTLRRADARLRISSVPGGASVTLDGVFQGRTPLELALDSAEPHELIAFKPGFERATRRLAPRPGSNQEIVLELRPLNGEVRITVDPADARIYSGSRLLGTGSGTLALPATRQTLVLRREGYAESSVEVTPRPGFPQDVTVRLRTLEQQKLASVKNRIRTGLGQELVLIRPGNFSMGSSRREVGRRANEAIREVRMQRPYYLGVAEVSNAEFRAFRPGHSSGNFKGKSLNGEEQPAAMVSWNDAALYCNWLSKRDGLPEFYRTAGSTVTGTNPASHGYRLPTEAEWAWAAIVQPGGTNLRFAWGAALPPPAKAGNFADTSGAALLGDTIAGYDDGHPVASPRKLFTPNRHGLFDMSGNAAEWVHDYYEAAPAAGSAAAVDPLGPDIGEFHVIRGSSWRHGNITELRLAFRDYGKDGRADVGFRIARYLE